MVLVFFFSSRKRHTRWTGDWISDVCSSDHAVLAPEPRQRVQERPLEVLAERGLPRGAARRSEERRVGKGLDIGGCRVFKKHEITSAKARQTRVIAPRRSGLSRQERTPIHGT